MGFVDTAFRARTAYGVDDCEAYPLFTPELIAAMRRLIPPERQQAVAFSVIVSAAKPANGRPGLTSPP